MGTYLPPALRTNEEVAQAAGVTAAWISERTGVLRRHTALPAQATSDLAAHAVRMACVAAGVTAGQLDLLVCASSSPDEVSPATACRVQAHVGASRACAFDVTAACSGWLFATRVAHDWLRVESGVRYAAVVGAEALSRLTDPSDRATAVLLADGAAAAILGPVPAGGGFHGFRLGSDGTGAHHVVIPAGGSRRPASAETLAEGGHRVHMDGRAVRDFVTETLPVLVEDELVRHGLTIDQIDAVVAHQPNPRLLRHLGEKIGIRPGRLIVTGDRTGNIGAASAPYALATAAAEGLLKSGSKVLLCVFGAGLTWGSSLLTWTGATALSNAPLAGRF
ncbi:3-oxoacyl-ACP synthase III family protein [Kitasatospora sp. LaBMicrA B282]|uniref:3-oxoacyl-ACP synthase III family protein n=1 Tax=Kitasatospora sp. LaBMicrA B282 TaxID=3420949 RepID=UPI003D124DCB